MYSGLKILIAEDNPVNQKCLLILLKKLGHYADTAMTGIEAIHALKNRRYDLIFMDIQMPKMDGIQATKIIRKLWPQGPKIIIVTAFPLEMYRDLCFKAGADDFLTKPVKIEELKASIDHYAQKDAISELEPIALI